MTAAPVRREDAVQWAPSGSFLDGRVGEMLLFLSKDGKHFGWGGGPGSAISFGLCDGTSLDVLPKQWVVRIAPDTYVVQDAEPEWLDEDSSDAGTSEAAGD